MYKNSTSTYTEKIFTRENTNLNFVQLKLNNTKQQQQK